MPNHNKLLNHPAMGVLREAIRQDLWLKLAVGALFLLGGLAMCWFFFQKQNILVAVGMGSILLGLWFVRDYLRRPRPEDDGLWQVLHRQPQQVVWVYTQEEQLMPFGMLLSVRGTLFVMLLDGSELALALPVEQLRLTSHFLKRLLPHAAFGFSEERKKQFEENPALMLKE